MDSEYAIEVARKQELLQQRFDDAAVIADAKKLERVQRLLSKIGQVDLEAEGLKSRENQRDLSIKFHWGHDHRFNEHLSVSGRMGDRHINLMAQFMVSYGLDDSHFQGKDVIDVGCWTGGTTLLLKLIGANHVLALEEVQKYASAAFELVSGIYEFPDLSCDGTNLYQLDTEKKYDIAYFPGVIYHLSDPVLALRRLFNGLKDGGEIFVESMGIDSCEPISLFEGNKKYHKAQGESAESLNRGGWNWFVPSQACLSLWLEEAGFVDVKCFYSPVTGRVFGCGKRESFVEITRAGLSVPDID